MNELTIEQHLKNIEIAVVKTVGNYDELTAIRTSFLYIKDLVLKKEEPKEEKKFEKTDLK